MMHIHEAYKAFAKRRFPTITENDVKDLERRIKVELPPDYREYLLEFNGGVFTEPAFASPDGEGPSDRLTFMHGLRPPFAGHQLGREADLAIWDENDPPQIVPIGYTMCGYFILLVTHRDDRGCILHRAFDESFFLAEGIEEFFSLLRAPQE